MKMTWKDGKGSTKVLVCSADFVIHRQQGALQNEYVLDNRRKLGGDKGIFQSFESLARKTGNAT